MTAIPHGPDHLYCPFWRQKMSKCCHTCPFWQMLRGVHPQTGEPIPDEWNCSLGHITKLLLENSQQMRQAGASADKVATEVDKFRKSVVGLASAADQRRTIQENGRGDDPKWISNG